MDNERTNDGKQPPEYQSIVDEVRLLVQKGITGKPLQEAIIGIQQKHPEDQAMELERDAIRALEMERTYEEDRRQEAGIKEESEKERMLEEMQIFFEKRNSEKPSPTQSTAKHTERSQSIAALKTGDKDLKKRRFKLTLPLQFDRFQNVLIDAKKNQSLPLPRRLVLVLSHFINHNAANGAIKKQLFYEEIAEVFEKERIRNKITKEKKRKATENEIETLYQARLAEKGEDFFAHQFARDFRKELARYEIDDKSVFACARGSKQYYLIDSAWHVTKPLKNNASAGRKMPGNSPKEDLGDPEDEQD